MPVEIRYPSFASGEPRPIRAVTVWAVAETMRRGIAGASPAPLEVGAMIRRAARLRINRRDLTLAWDIEHAVHDGTGEPVFGVCEHDPCEPGTVLISINAEMLADRPDLMRSTAAHELGHAVFDMPAAIGSMRPRQSNRIMEREMRATPIDWREWRADEFMGALLAPPSMTRKAAVRHAAEMPVKVAWRLEVGVPAPLLVGTDDAIEAVGDQLACDFGVSTAFMAVRMRKYGLVI